MENQSDENTQEHVLINNSNMQKSNTVLIFKANEL